MALLLHSLEIQCQTLAWARTTGAFMDDNSNTVVTDAGGNIYVAGCFSSTVDLDPGPTTDLHISNGNQDCFIQKLDPQGNFIWGKAIGGNSWDIPNAISIDPSGNVIVTGHFQSSVDFDPGTGTDIHTANAHQDVFVMKLDNSGNFIWVRCFGGTNQDISRSAFVNNAGEIYVTGSFGSSIDLDPGTGTDIHNWNGSLDVFIVKIDASGNYIWGKTIGSGGQEDSYAITQDLAGDVIITGFAMGTVDFDPGTATYNLTLDAVAYDVFVWKLGSNGNFIWAIAFGGPLTDDVYAMATDQGNNIYVAGCVAGAIDFDPGPGTSTYTTNGNSRDIFIAKLSSAGTLKWVKAYGSGLDDNAFGLVYDGSGNLYLTGYFQNSVDFDFTASTDSHSSNGLWDVFIQKIDTAGNYKWTKTVGSDLYNDFGRGITIDKSGHLIVCGTFDGTVDFDPGTPVQSHISNGSEEAFVCKFSFGSDTGLNSSTLQQFSLYPNPNQGEFRIQCGLPDAKLHFELYNSSGQILYSGIIKDGNEQFAIENMQSGSYFYLLKNAENQLKSGTLVVE